MIDPSPRSSIDTPTASRLCPNCAAEVGLAIASCPSCGVSQPIDMVSNGQPLGRRIGGTRWTPSTPLVDELLPVESSHGISASMAEQVDWPGRQSHRRRRRWYRHPLILMFGVVAAFALIAAGVIAYRGDSTIKTIDSSYNSAKDFVAETAGELALNLLDSLYVGMNPTLPFY